MTGELFPLVALEVIDVSEANHLLVKWSHPLGACNRPFHQEAHALIVDGGIAAVTVSASTVGSTSGGRPRAELVELARIGRSPELRWVLRPMLRLWREVAARRWSSWSALAAVSYALPGTPGDLYRFDGWTRLGTVRPSRGGGTWSKRPKVLDVADGVKTLWGYAFDEAEWTTGDRTP